MNASFENESDKTPGKSKVLEDKSDKGERQNPFLEILMRKDEEPARSAGKRSRYSGENQQPDDEDL